jgi:hypothetical protein
VKGVLLAGVELVALVDEDGGPEELDLELVSLLCTRVKTGREEGEGERTGAVGVPSATWVRSILNMSY